MYHRFLSLEAEGQQIQLEFSHETGMFLLKTSMGFYSDFNDFYNKHTQKLEVWQKRLINIANTTREETLIADIFCLVGYINILWVSPLLLMEQHSGKVFNKEAVLEQTRKNLVWAIGIYSKRRLIDRVLRTNNLLADILTYEEKNNEASEITSNVSNLADDLSYAHIKYVADNPFSKGVIESTGREIDNDKSHIDLNDATIKLYAQQRVEALNLPESRIPVAESYLYSYRDIANERFEWCQYIELNEDKTPTFSQSTYYLSEPDRLILCQLHPFKSDLPSTDWQTLISEFKSKYCDKCSDRNPKSKNE